ncbi:GAF domain-containing sensor histidine kinase [Halalkalibacter nanhaiisediminis]|uniref:histidine kinase n=1 Tax=Halalkalibacter nanhaiisediminis TaxID=688079 RepID=A0A562QK58_9BACI|nr:ATP-binding protein [Halalkalibacter nanhaiisediminis]TWI57129.1 two-component system NtrC family sensor kinase [Halalkalibacter nanhaiisediminis]
MNNKLEMIDLLTGVKSSKRNYYMELKKTISELQKKNMQLEIINDVMKSFNVDMSMDDMLGNTLEKLKQIFRLERLCLSIVENEQLIVSNVYPSYPKSLQKGNSIPKEHSLFWTVMTTRSACTHTFSKQNRMNMAESKFFYELGIRQILLFPLISKDKVIGILSVESKQLIEYEEEDYSFFQQLSDQLAVCTENARLYNRVLASKKEWEETFRAVPNMIFLIDLKGNILLFNDAVKDFFPYEEKVIYEKTWNELLSQHLVDESENLLTETIRTKKLAYRQLTIQDRICELHSYPSLNENEELTGVIIYMNDVTDKLQIEAQLIHSGKLAAIGEMAAGVAHELNNPLTAILGHSQLLLRSANKETSTYEMLSDIKNCGERCKHIIRSLLTFSRQDEYVFEKCSVNKAVEQVLNLIRYQIEHQHISIELKLMDELPYIDGSLQQIEQIVINLLLNAKHALEEREDVHRKIVIETSLNIKDGEEMISLSVTDNGTGIAEENLQEIFNPFFTTKKAIKGSGLGLSVSLGIAKVHGGTIEVISQVEIGSTFTLYLPRNQYKND